ncbi:helical backbone metal receptor [Sulfurimonas sp. HSL-1716]|uniref:ABC transporter substrate-binding protein n=1 Tax=Hydrocurvibacter sulfurireducens TaxID=3131937 RepID=UPI0031FA2100
MSIRTIFGILFFMLTLWGDERIISLSPSITEIVYGLGGGKEMVATSEYSLYPKEARELPVIGGYGNPNLEKIVSARPTLVIGQDFNSAVLQKLQKFGIKTLMLRLQTIDEIKSSISKVAQTISKQKNAAKLIKEINDALKDAKKAKKPHSVMIVYGLKEDLRGGIYIAGHDIFFEDIIKACGNTNAYTSKLLSQPVLSYENVIALDPQQIIILHSKATEPNVDVKRALHNWYTLPTEASKNKKISIVDENYLHIPSQRVSLTIKRLCREMND